MQAGMPTAVQGQQSDTKEVAKAESSGARPTAVRSVESAAAAAFTSAGSGGGGGSGGSRGGGASGGGAPATPSKEGSGAAITPAATENKPDNDSRAVVAKKGKTAVDHVAAPVVSVTVPKRQPDKRMDAEARLQAREQQVSWFCSSCV